MVEMRHLPLLTISTSRNARAQEVQAIWVTSERFKSAQHPDSSLACQPDGPKTSGMNKVAKNSTSGSLLPLITDRSVSTPQTRPVVQLHCWAKNPKP